MISAALRSSPASAARHRAAPACDRNRSDAARRNRTASSADSGARISRIGVALGRAVACGRGKLKKFDERRAALELRRGCGQPPAWRRRNQCQQQRDDRRRERAASRLHLLRCAGGTATPELASAAMRFKQAEIAFDHALPRIFAADGAGERSRPRGRGAAPPASACRSRKSSPRHRAVAQTHRLRSVRAQHFAQRRQVGNHHRHAAMAASTAASPNVSQVDGNTNRSAGSVKIRDISAPATRRACAAGRRRRARRRARVGLRGLVQRRRWRDAPAAVRPARG